MSDVAVKPSYFTVLNREYYVSEGIYALEREHVFRRQWTFAAHGSELQAPGDFVTVSVHGESLILVRGDDGEIRGFHNVCRHRGYELCEKASGKAKRFVCPYHQWSYARDGSLVRAPGARPGEFFDYGDWGLRPVHVEVWEGFVFVAIGDEAPDPISPQLDRFCGELRAVRPQGLRVAQRDRLRVRTNWKTLLENYLECYHCQGSHPELCKAISIEGAYEKTSNWSGQYFGGGVPMKRDVLTASMDGQLVSSPLGDFATMDDIPLGYSAGFGMVPLLTRILGQVDHVIVQCIRPESVGSTTWETTWLVREDAVSGVDYDVDALVDVWRRTNLQDASLVEGAYRGVLSQSFIPGPLHPEREPAIRAALQEYRRLMDIPEVSPVGSRPAA